jgi:hypothetical protein
MNMAQTSLSVLMLASIVGLSSPPARAAIVPFTGGVVAQEAWRTAVGSYVFEGFESFSINTPITSLSALGLTVDPLAGGVQPGIYQHGVNNTPSGQRQLANFPGNCCITGTFQLGDLIMQVDPAVDLLAFAFWNGDPQGNAALRIYNRSGVLIGTVTALINTGSSAGLSNSFAGFISTEPVGRLEFEGAVGDGWNHYDDFHASFAADIPEPGTFALMLVGLGVLCRAVRRHA